MKTVFTSRRAGETEVPCGDARKRDWDAHRAGDGIGCDEASRCWYPIGDQYVGVVEPQRTRDAKAPFEFRRGKGHAACMRVSNGQETSRRRSNAVPGALIRNRHV